MGGSFFIMRAYANSSAMRRRNWTYLTPGNFWQDLDHRTRLIETLRESGGQLLNEEVIWKTKQGQPVHLLISSGRLPRRPHQLRRRQADLVGLRHHGPEACG